MIKVGDWAKWTDEVVKVTHIYDEPNQIWYTILSNNGITTVPQEALEKLPIKFKGLNPVFKSIGRVEFWCQRRYLKDIGEVYFDISLNNGRVFVIFRALGKSPISGGVSTIDQAKDWLELQYATMLAKARRLV